MLNIFQEESLGGLASLTNLQGEVNSISGGDRCQVTIWYLLRINTECIESIQNENLRNGESLSDHLLITVINQ